MSKLFIKRGTKCICESAYEDRGDVGALFIPEGVRDICDCAFIRCLSLRDIPLPESLRHIGNMAFADTDVREIVIPDRVERVGEMAFAFNPELLSLHIGRSVKEIKAGAFSGCSKLEKITVNPENDNYYVQNGCLIEKKSQKLIVATHPYTVPEGVKVVELRAFMFLTNCAAVTLPESVEQILNSDDGRGNFEVLANMEFNEKGETVKYERAVIKAPKGSYAARYAKENNIKLVEI